MSTGVSQQPWLPKPGDLTSVPTPYYITFSRKKLSDGVKPYQSLLPRANERKHGNTGGAQQKWLRESTYSTPTTASNGSNASVRRTVHTRTRARTHTAANSRQQTRGSARLELKRLAIHPPLTDSSVSWEWYVRFAGDYSEAES